MPMRHRGRIGVIEIAAIVATVAALSACSNNSAPPDSANIGNQFASTFCAAESRCCQLQGDPLPAGEQSCEQLQQGIPYQGQAFGGNTNFNADIAAECLKAAQSYDCTDSSDIDQLCRLVLSGTAALGGDCLVDSDCAQAPNAHALCMLGSDTCVAVPLFGRAGAPCLGKTHIECAFYEGFTCVVDAASPTGMSCRLRSPVGGPCATAYECAAGTFCAPAETCAADSPDGQSCDNTHSCGPLSQCMNGLCVGNTSGSCRAL
jgi:hypothetical protein